MSDAASFDAVMQCNLLEVFCEALGAGILVWDKLDNLAFGSVRLLQFFPIREAAIQTGQRSRDFFGHLYDAGCRFGMTGQGLSSARNRDEWIAERVAWSWKERVDSIEQFGPDRFVRVVNRRFSSGLGFTVLQDISEHKKKENFWRAEQERVRLTEEILDSLPVGVAIKDRNLNFVAVNQEFCRLHGKAAEDVLGRSAWDVVGPEAANSMEEADWLLLAGGEDRQSTIAIHDADGATTEAICRARRIGKPGHHYLSMSFDPLPSARDTAEAVSRPVEPPPSNTSVRGDGDDSQMAPAIAGTADRGIRRKAVIVGGQVAGLAELIRPVASRGVEICQLDDDIELRAFLPAARTAGLAIDFVFYFGTQPALHSMAAAAGIPACALDAGLGAAAIIGSICDVLDIEMVDRLVADRHMPEPLPAQPANRLAISIDALVVEDNPVNRLAAEQICESLGLRFAVAINGSEAIAKAAEFKPRIILADLTLPDLAPADLVAGLRQVFALGQAPIIGMITRDCDESRLICQAAGMQACLVKPLNLDAVEAIVSQHLLARDQGPIKFAKNAA